MSFILSVYYEEESCIHCYATFALTTDALSLLKKTRNTFWCPYCKGAMHYGGKTNEQKLRDKLRKTEINLEAERACCTELKQEVKHKDKVIYGHKGAYNKIKKQLSK